MRLNKLIFSHFVWDNNAQPIVQGGDSNNTQPIVQGGDSNNSQPILLKGADGVDNSFLTPKSSLLRLLRYNNANGSQLF